MRNIYTFINESALATVAPDNFSYRNFCASLVLGDLKNDRLPRSLRLSVVGSNEADLLDAISKNHELDSSCDVYVVGFSHVVAGNLKAQKDLLRFKLFVVNAPKQRHPAALVGIADATKRVKDHHLYARSPDAYDLLRFDIKNWKFMSLG